jgi:hypothetical protein
MATSNKAKFPAITYLRTSSAANVGADKDSDRRQRAGYELVGEFYDAAVSGKERCLWKGRTCRWPRAYNRPGA